jgi:hypothetical protein
MGVSVGIARFAFSIIGGIGSLLFILGFFALLSNGQAALFIPAVALSVAGELGTFYLTKYEDRKQQDMFRLNFWTVLGATYAFPVLLLVFYFLSPDKFVLALTAALSAQALLHTAALLAKLWYLEELG